MRKTQIIALLLVPTLAAAAARASVPFDTFVVGLRSTCAKAPSTHCARAIGDWLDADRDGGAALTEVERARDRAQRSARDEASSLNSTERTLTTVSLMVLQHAGLPEVFANFDGDRNGRLSQAELFADFRLDHRPFKDIVNDPAAVDWESFAARFGKVGFLITDLLPPSHRKQR